MNFLSGTRREDKMTTNGDQSAQSLAINKAVNIQWRMLPGVTFFIRNYKACWVLENIIGTVTLLSVLSKCFKEQKAH